MNSSPTPISPADKRRRIDGRWILLALLVLVITVPLAVWGTLRWMEARHAASPLDWSQRHTWPLPEVVPSSLQATGVARMLGGGEWRSLPFTVPPEEEAAVEHLRHVALSRPFHLPEVREQIEAVVAEQPDLFYGHYLLSTWHRLAGNTDLADQAMTRAVRLAPVVLRQRYITPSGEPIAELQIGAMEIENNRVLYGQLDQSLTLVYPHLVTDNTGSVWLPTYRTVYRMPTQPHPPGYVTRYPDLRFFEAPAQAASLPPAVVQPAK